MAVAKKVAWLREGATEHSAKSSTLKPTSTAKPKTLEGYAAAFRMTVAQVAGVPSGNERSAYRIGSHQRWQSAVHAFSLDQITPAAIEQWKAAGLSAYYADGKPRKTLGLGRPFS